MNKKTKWLLITYLGIPLLFFLIEILLSTKILSNQGSLIRPLFWAFPILVGCTSILFSSYRYAKKILYVFFFPWLVYTIVHILTLFLSNKLFELSGIQVFKNSTGILILTFYIFLYPALLILASVGGAIGNHIKMAGKNHQN